MLRLLIYLVSYILFPTIANTHVQHYKNLQRIEFDIYRNNDLVGYHKVNVKKKGDNTKEIITDILSEVNMFLDAWKDDVVNGTTNKNSRQLYNLRIS